ncbi:hypothetical protein LWE69_19725 [Paenibacillus sp. UKAQ_18]|nr:hypothetical protein [Paenibacillus sp. UKAQ_18]
MKDKPRLIDADKLIKWFVHSPDSDGFLEGSSCVNSFNSLTDAISSGLFNPDPPQQPDIQVGDRVQHKWIDHGVGTVMGFSECLINVQFPDVYASCFEENLLKVEGKKE